LHQALSRTTITENNNNISFINLTLQNRITNVYWEFLKFQIRYPEYNRSLSYPIPFFFLSTILTNMIVEWNVEKIFEENKFQLLILLCRSKLTWNTHAPLIRPNSSVTSRAYTLLLVIIRTTWKVVGHRLNNWNLRHVNTHNF
jgi:hypothetical protein